MSAGFCCGKRTGTLPSLPVDFEKLDSEWRIARQYRELQPAAQRLVDMTSMLMRSLMVNGVETFAFAGPIVHALNGGRVRRPQVELITVPGEGAAVLEALADLRFEATVRGPVPFEAEAIDQYLGEVGFRLAHRVSVIDLSTDEALRSPFEVVVTTSAERIPPVDLRKASRSDDLGTLGDVTRENVYFDDYAASVLTLPEQVRRNIVSRDRLREVRSATPEDAELMLGRLAMLDFTLDGARPTDLRRELYSEQREYAARVDDGKALLMREYGLEVVRTFGESLGSRSL